MTVIQIGTKYLDKAGWQRFLSIEPEALKIDTEKRTVKISISSATPCDRGFFSEVLVHSREAIDLSRVSGGCQALFNHNPNEYVGIVEDAWLDPDQERCYALVRFDTHPTAEQVFQSIQGGILRNISIGYRVKDWEVIEKSDQPVLRVVDWELLEVSFVTIPADPSVGVGRSLSPESDSKGYCKDKAEEPTEAEPPEMEDDEEEGIEIEIEVKTAQIEEGNRMSEQLQTELLEAERERTASLMALGDQHNLGKDLVQKWIHGGVDLQSARSQVLDVIQKRETQTVKPLNALGLDNREVNQYSIAKAIHNRLQVMEGRSPQQGLELEVHKAIEEKLGRPTEGIYVPVRDLNWGRAAKSSYGGRRDILQTAQPELGGNLVDTELRSSDFIEALRNRAMISRLGARMLSGLTGDVDIPRQSGTATVYWISEGGTIPESNLTLDLLKLRPKDVSCLTAVSRRMLMQSSLDIESLIRADMIKEMSLGIDQAAIQGTGVESQPLGLLNYPGINSVSIGANGGALAWNHIVQLETEIAVDNADTGACHYLTNARVRGKLKTTPKVTGQDVFLWQDSTIDRGMGNMNGYSAAVSNQVPRDGSKGTGNNLSAVIFGDFSQLLIAEWGVLEILPNPYGAGYPSGSIQIRSLATIDVAPRRPEYFAVCTDVVTT